MHHDTILGAACLAARSRCSSRRLLRPHFHVVYPKVALFFFWVFPKGQNPLYPRAQAKIEKDHPPPLWFHENTMLSGTVFWGEVTSCLRPVLVVHPRAQAKIEKDHPPPLRFHENVMLSGAAFFGKLTPCTCSTPKSASQNRKGSPTSSSVS